jgi:hypothetical protein
LGSNASSPPEDVLADTSVPEPSKLAFHEPMPSDVAAHNLFGIMKTITTGAFMVCYGTALLIIWCLTWFVSEPAFSIFMVFVMTILAVCMAESS